MAINMIVSGQANAPALRIYKSPHCYGVDCSGNTNEIDYVRDDDSVGARLIFLPILSPSCAAEAKFQIFVERRQLAPSSFAGVTRQTNLKPRLV